MGANTLKTLERAVRKQLDSLPAWFAPAATMQTVTALLDEWKEQAQKIPVATLRQLFLQTVTENGYVLDEELTRLQGCLPSKVRSNFLKWVNAAASGDTGLSTRTSSDQNTQLVDFAQILAGWLFERGIKPPKEDGGDAPQQAHSSGRKRKRIETESAPASKELLNISSYVDSTTEELRRVMAIIASIPGATANAITGIAFENTTASTAFFRRQFEDAIQQELHADPIERRKLARNRCRSHAGTGDAGTQVSATALGEVCHDLTISKVAAISGAPAHWAPRPLLVTAPPAFAKIVSPGTALPRGPAPRISIKAVQDHFITSPMSENRWILPIYVDISVDNGKYKLRDFYLWDIYEERITPIQFAQAVVEELQLPSQLARHIADCMLAQLQEFANRLKLDAVAAARNIRKSVALALADSETKAGRGDRQIRFYNILEHLFERPTYSNTALLQSEARTAPVAVQSRPSLPWTPQISPFAVLNAWIHSTFVPAAHLLASADAVDLDAWTTATLQPLCLYADVLYSPPHSVSSHEQPAQARLRAAVRVDLSTFLSPSCNPLLQSSQELISTVGAPSALLHPVFASLQFGMNNSIVALSQYQQYLLHDSIYTLASAEPSFTPVHVVPSLAASVDELREAGLALPEANIIVHESWHLKEPSHISRADVAERYFPALTVPTIPSSSIKSSFVITNQSMGREK